MTAKTCAAMMALVAALAGCAVRNPPLPVPAAPDREDYRYEHLPKKDAAGRDVEKTFVILTFSGGGTRAAAFAYGVLQALYEQPIAGGERLLDEVDVISSVSGGSFASAYLGLFGPERFIREFPDAVLHRKLESGLLLRILAPWNWPRLLSPRFSRSDLATEYYDRKIFDHQTFQSLRGKRPFVVLNATDIAQGAQFSFTQDHFDRICSDLDPLPVARGVTASSAFPIVFPPVTLTNYPKKCGRELPAWVDQLLTPDPDLEPPRAPADVNPPGYALAANWKSYAQRSLRYVHLSDGGLSDNIGLRAPYNALSVDQWGLREAINTGRIERLVFITVDAKPKSESRLDKCARPASFPTVLNAAATNPMENYSADTIELVRTWFREWDDVARRYDRSRERCDELAEETCGQAQGSCFERQRDACRERFRATDAKPPPHPTLYRVHVRFDAIPESEAKRRMQGVATRLQLPRDEVDDLVKWGGKLLRSAPEYETLLRDLGAP